MDFLPGGVVDVHIDIWSFPIASQAIICILKDFIQRRYGAINATNGRFTKRQGQLDS